MNSIGLADMTYQERRTAEMTCDNCRSSVTPAADSTPICAWYTCDCGHAWSSRLRDGRPTVVLSLASLVRSRAQQYR